MNQDMTTILQTAIERDPRSLYKFAKDCNLPYATVHRFVRGERVGISLTTAAVLAQALGLELRPVRRKGG